MIKRVKTPKIGDVFVAKITDTSKKYIQLIAIDKEQLNSDVIRAFKKSYPAESEPSLEEIISDEVEFHAHLYVKLGIKLEFWKLAGNTSDIGNIDNILFFGTAELPNIFGVFKTKWWVWKINGEYIYSSKPKKKYKSAEDGFVEPPILILDRLRGTYKGRCFERKYYIK